MTLPLAELPPITEATALAREVEFAYPIPGAPGRGLVKGFIDALVAYGDDLWVLDYKSDRLANPARAREHAFEHYGAQRNWAIDHLPIASPWTLHVDADEFLALVHAQDWQPDQG